jgi:uncharacterized cupin superfamily protein
MRVPVSGRRGFSEAGLESGAVGRGPVGTVGEELCTFLSGEGELNLEHAGRGVKYAMPN